VEEVTSMDMTKIGRACGKCGEKRYAYQVLVGKSEGKKLLGRSRHRCENKLK
jgi:hypothetical protein